MWNALTLTGMRRLFHHTHTSTVNSIVEVRKWAKRISSKATDENQSGVADNLLAADLYNRRAGQHDRTDHHVVTRLLSFPGRVSTYCHHRWVRVTFYLQKRVWHEAYGIYWGSHIQITECTDIWPLRFCQVFEKELMSTSGYVYWCYLWFDTNPSHRVFSTWCDTKRSLTASPDRTFIYFFNDLCFL